MAQGGLPMTFSLIRLSCAPPDRFSMITSDYRLKSKSHTPSGWACDWIRQEENSHISRIEFPTGSSYEGGYNCLGMSGFGRYTFHNGLVYEGNFRDGEFDGEGTLTYPKGQKLHGKWSKGHLISSTYQFKDGMVFDKVWKYCKYPDARFNQSIKDGLNPAGKELLTNDRIPRRIPSRCFDCGEGFYHADHKYIFSAVDRKKVLKIPRRQELEFITRNYRKAWDEPTGYKPELYKDWTTGRKRSKTRLLKKITVEEERLSMILNSELMKL